MKQYHKEILFLFILSLIFFAVFSGCSLKKINNKKAMLLYQDGIKLSSKGDFEGALKKFNKSIEVSKKNGFKYGVAHNYNEIGNIYTYGNNFDIAREYFHKALTIYKSNKMDAEVSKSLDNISKTYVRQGDYKKAMEQYEILLAWDKTSKNRLGAGITNFNMALLCERYTLDFKKALFFYKEALHIFIELKREKEAFETRKGIKRMTF